jgi:hypothetical protein
MECLDSPSNFADADGHGCTVYAKYQYCNADGSAGINWVADQKFSDYSNRAGDDAGSACCGCGGGQWYAKSFNHKDNQEILDSLITQLRGKSAAEQQAILDTFTTSEVALITEAYERSKANTNDKNHNGMGQSYARERRQFAGLSAEEMTEVHSLIAGLSEEDHSVLQSLVERFSAAGTEAEKEAIFNEAAFAPFELALLKTAYNHLGGPTVREQGGAIGSIGSVTREWRQVAGMSEEDLGKRQRRQLVGLSQEDNELLHSLMGRLANGETEAEKHAILATFTSSEYALVYQAYEMLCGKVVRKRRQVAGVSEEDIIANNRERRQIVGMSDEDLALLQTLMKKLTGFTADEQIAIMATFSEAEMGLINMARIQMEQDNKFKNRWATWQFFRMDGSKCRPKDWSTTTTTVSSTTATTTTSTSSTQTSTSKTQTSSTKTGTETTTSSTKTTTAKYVEPDAIQVGVDTTNSKHAFTKATAQYTKPKYTTGQPRTKPKFNGEVDVAWDWQGEGVQATEVAPLDTLTLTAIISVGCALVILAGLYTVRKRNATYSYENLIANSAEARGLGAKRKQNFYDSTVSDQLTQSKPYTHGGDAY